MTYTIEFSKLCRGGHSDDKDVKSIYFFFFYLNSSTSQSFNHTCLFYCHWSLLTRPLSSAKTTLHVLLFNCVSFPVLAGPVVNDGGLSWLRKSYQRMKEQAEREKRSLDDVVAERYGVRTDGTQAAAAHTFTFMIYQCTYGYVGKATAEMRMLHYIYLLQMEIWT